ncbi:MAG: GNAT family N-acetyltransferase [Candidatus Rokubacteria bacterium]|nr:GNAT family N-acetyltransferase [Candidatus Rokubacteria bacterium]
MIVRVLGRGDETRLDVFLASHADSSMLLRANLGTGGIEDRGEPYQATYAAALDGDRVVAVAAHTWLGGILLQAPEQLDAVVRHVAERSGRRVGGLVGPWAQVVAARAALGLGDQPTRLASREILYALALGNLVVPPALASGAVACRRPTDEDLPLIVAWRTAYNVEANRVPADGAGRERARAEAERWHAERVQFLLTRDGEPVAYSAFNAHLPEMVQVGGVWTPPALRSRGYARCVVAGSLLAARAEGAHRAILFTGEENVPAQRAYEALGFHPVGDYGLLFFR